MPQLDEDLDALFQSMVDAGGSFREMRIPKPWWYRAYYPAQMPLIYLIAWGWAFPPLLWLLGVHPAVYHFLVYPAIALLSVALLYGGILARGRWVRALPGKWVRPGESVSAAAQRLPNAIPTAGMITAVRAPGLPAMVWRYVDESRFANFQVVAQPFAVTAGEGFYLVESDFIEPGSAFRFWDFGGHAGVGAEVYLAGEKAERVPTAAWLGVRRDAMGHRDQRIRRIKGTASAPVRILVSSEKPSEAF